CDDASPARLHVVVGDGPGLVGDRLVAASDRDLAIIDGGGLVQIDVAARTWRRLGPPALAALDGPSRRLVTVDGTRVVVRDPGVAPRTIDTGKPIAGLWLHGKRWLEVGSGDTPYELTQGACGYLHVDPSQVATDRRTTIDLDPAGVEAPERIGPELGITAGGEVTLDGTKVIGADCVADVIAALAEPPRALVMCNGAHNHVVGPGFDKEVGGVGGGAREQAVIADDLLLGQRVVCVTGACIDLVTGRDFDTYEQAAVWYDDRYLVRRKGGGLVIDDLDHERQREVLLPRLTQAVTIDTATGRRTAGAAPKAPAYLDASGDYLLYGRHVVDVDQATLVATLADDALAVDRSGRVLLPAAEGQGPLRWKRP
ncbi:MAG TPA: hypothetical protein VHE35_07620, partial [Kofleriaceae bacterium]|nr:hypothetical protein [Kofleriaceae bacterium]